jgi:4-hydroxy-tetrahydrodipicolinate synthase
MFKGSITALVTPFKNGAVDGDCVMALAERQIAAGTHGLVPCGTTGENPTLSFDEHMQVVEWVISVAKGKIPVIAGSGSNDTAVAIRNTQRVEALGADAALIVAPYYNKPDQAGLYAHFKAIHDESRIPIILYNVPGRTVADIQPDTVGRLAELDRVVGIKDATGALDRVSWHRRLAGEDFIQLSGDDPTALGFNATGGVGSISVTSNVAPELCADFQSATLRGDWAEARRLNDLLMPLHKALFSAPSPGPAKYALSLMGLCTQELRLPLIEPEQAVEKKVREALALSGMREPA